MTNEELGRRATACKHWRWMPGMLCVWPSGTEYRVAQVSGVDGINDLPNYPSNGWGDDYPDRTTGMPYLRDAATLGCLLELVREAWGYPWLSVVGDAEGLWRIDAEECEGVEDLHSLASEAEALVAALEAAP